MILYENIFSSLGPPAQQPDNRITFGQSGLRSKMSYCRVLYCDVRKSRFIFLRGMKLLNVCTVQNSVIPLTYRRFPIYAVIMFRMIRRKSNCGQVGIRCNMARCVGIHKGVQRESQRRHNGVWSATARPPRHLSYSSAVFFRQFVYIAISSPQQKCYYSGWLLFYGFVSLELCNLIPRQSDSICQQKVNVKQSLYRPGQALNVPGAWGAQVSWQSAHEGGQVVSPSHRPPLPLENIPCTHFCWKLSRPKVHKANVNRKFQWHRKSNPRTSGL
jgi:hypothetical protein